MTQALTHSRKKGWIQNPTSHGKEIPLEILPQPAMQAAPPAATSPPAAPFQVNMDGKEQVLVPGVIRKSMTPDFIRKTITPTAAPPDYMSAAAFPYLLGVVAPPSSPVVTKELQPEYQLPSYLHVSRGSNSGSNKDEGIPVASVVVAALPPSSPAVSEELLHEYLTYSGSNSGSNGGSSGKDVGISVNAADVEEEAKEVAPPPGVYADTEAQRYAAPRLEDAAFNTSSAVAPAAPSRPRKNWFSWLFRL